MLIFYNEIKLLEENLPEEMDMMASANIKKALDQLEYYDIHSSFKHIKNAVIRQFLINQEINLKSHVSDRALNLLKLAKQYEVSNQKSILNQISKNVLDEIAAIHAKPSKEILDSAFKSALAEVSDSFALCKQSLEESGKNANRKRAARAACGDDLCSDAWRQIDSLRLNSSPVSRYLGTLGT